MPRAVSLGSTTLAPADATPVEVVALPGMPRVASVPKSLPNSTVVPRSATVVLTMRR